MKTIGALVVGLVVINALSKSGGVNGSKSILLVGDSLSVGNSSPFALLLAEFKKDGLGTIKIANGGYSTSTYLKGGKLEKVLLVTPKTEVCFLALGTNDAANISISGDTKKALNTYIENFEKIVEILEKHCDKIIGFGSEFFGTAAEKKYPGINDIAKQLNAGIEHCFDSFVDFYDVTKSITDNERTKDGVHFPKSSALKIAKELKERL